jgi:non-specific serine/threonine protein kinase/serine/threonine-protein kinase
MLDGIAHHPTQIDSYRVIRVIGEGGMGVVYEAEQFEPIRRNVAVKMIRAGCDSLYEGATDAST